MPNRILALLSAAMLAGAVCPARALDNKIVIPVTRSSPWDGKQMYGDYCAACHGADGRGSGPVAHELKQTPTDLTELAKNNHGKYPDNHVMAVLRFGTSTPAHGTAQMPVWGPVFRQLNTHNTNEQRVRLFNLTKYLETLQAK